MRCRNCVRFVCVDDDCEITLGKPNWCFYRSDSPDPDLERECSVFRPLTRADRFRRMTDERLAAFLAEHPVAAEYDENNPYHRYWLAWLQEEVDE